jgi:hypothetical protein
VVPYGESRVDTPSDHGRRVVTWGDPPPTLYSMELMREVYGDVCTEDELRASVAEQLKCAETWDKPYGIIYRDKRYRCPQCHQDTLAFERYGLWD